MNLNLSVTNNKYDYYWSDYELTKSHTRKKVLQNKHKIEKKEINVEHRGDAETDCITWQRG